MQWNFCQWLHFVSPTVEVDRGYAHILELSNTTSNFLFEVSEAKEGGVSVSFRKYPILDTDSIFKMRIGSSSKPHVTV